ncbi:MAG: rhodanese-like domain-containing protein [Hymenobacteraceae bacterium]|nr:rhodanese-like domain-containing protein [Hymenobacteraceae bacterium]MDX5397306.1 rhodanese-like domain-containing protein [Hymenobacteraceae bacterium]MDX5513384.1 rhodanese-like domain-containing protein [Hymenobacteraceae bacterium]
MQLKNFFALAFTLSALWLSACGQTYDALLKTLYKNTVPVIKADELEKQLLQNNPIILLDTRSAKEYQVSHLPGALFIDYESFSEKAVENIPADATVVVYCSVGYRSERIGEKLKGLGYKQVYNLYGGIFDWVNKGNVVVNDSGKTNQVHAYSKTWGVWLQKGEKVYDN